MEAEINNSETTFSREFLQEYYGMSQTVRDFWRQATALDERESPPPGARYDVLCNITDSSRLKFINKSWMSDAGRLTDAGEEFKGTFKRADVSSVPLPEVGEPIPTRPLLAGDFPSSHRLINALLPVVVPDSDIRSNFKCVNIISGMAAATNGHVLIRIKGAIEHKGLVNVYSRKIVQESFPRVDDFIPADTVPLISSMSIKAGDVLKRIAGLYGKGYHLNRRRYIWAGDKICFNPEVLSDLFLSFRKLGACKVSMARVDTEIWEDSPAMFMGNSGNYKITGLAMGCRSVTRDVTDFDFEDIARACSPPRTSSLLNWRKNAE